jgi:hypothetical protein
MAKKNDWLDKGDTWAAAHARAGLPVLIALAESAGTMTYTEFMTAAARSLYKDEPHGIRNAAHALRIIGRSLEQLSQEWGEHVPPLTLLVISKNAGEASLGVDPFLEHYVDKTLHQNLTAENRAALIRRVKDDVYAYPHWDEVLAHFGQVPVEITPRHAPIELPQPSPIEGGASEEHATLKHFVAAHPELFASIGAFGAGSEEKLLMSADRVDVLFENADQTLVVEVRPANADLGELTRGLFQCVKYIAVLRATYDLAARLVNVRAVLVTPQPIPARLRAAAQRLGVLYQRVRA